MAFVSHYGKGRTFHCVLGHDAKALSVPAVQELYRRGCAWAAGLAAGSRTVRPTNEPSDSMKLTRLFAFLSRTLNWRTASRLEAGDTAGLEACRRCGLADSNWIRARSAPWPRLPAGAADPPISIDSKLDQGVLEVRYKGHKLLVYAFATNQFKPYVRELYTLRGENVTRDAPPDHLHHHGLMYAVYVNGINFWEERGTPGIEKHVEMPLHTAQVGRRWDAARRTFTETHPLAGADQPVQPPDSLAAALLIEQRTLTVTVGREEPGSRPALGLAVSGRAERRQGDPRMARITTGWACACRSRSTTSPSSRTPPISLTPANNTRM